MMNFDMDCENQLLVNNRLADSEKKIFFELKNEFEKKFSDRGYFLVASSGSSQKADESIKLIALSCESVLNSARRFNAFFKATNQESWGLVLPAYHVAGLGVFARAFLSGAQVFSLDWDIHELQDWIIKNNICFMSMVPTQIFDIIQSKITAPNSIKKIFVGGGGLSEDLKRQILDLKWPIIETYGMTETSSMIAVKDVYDYRLLPDVEVLINSNLLAIKSDSNLTAIIQKISDKIVVTDYSYEKFFQTADRAELIIKQTIPYLHLLGRDTDYFKILGEGVSLTELRSHLDNVMAQFDIPQVHCEIINIFDDRNQNKLILVVEDLIDFNRAHEIINVYNQICRPYEKIQKIISIGQIPRTELGKLKRTELSRIVMQKLKKEANGEY